MFFLLKLVLIILLNKIYAQDSQIILLPTWNSINANNISLTLKVFGQLVQLNLCKTDQMVSPMFDIWKYNTMDIIKKWSQSEVSDSCFYVHKDRVSYAIINFCQKHGLEGLIFPKNDILTIKPFRDNFVSLSLIDDFYIREQVNISFRKYHLIKRSRKFFNNLNFYYLNNFKSKRSIRSTQKKLVMELAVFFDKTAYDIFMPFLNNSEEQLRNMILAYVNSIQASFHHPSFGVSLDISLVRLDIMEKQLLDFPVSNEASKLLNLFCKYAETLNPSDDNDPHHWDIGLYMTGRNIYTIKNHERNFIAGAAISDGMCNLSISCAIVVFGSAKDITSGFASSFTASHEIGHVLGIEHDLDLIERNSDSEWHCPDYKYIMSTNQLNRGQITWSECSSDVAKELWRTKTCLLDHNNQKNYKDGLDHTRYDDLPGKEWTAKAQCELYLRDKDANVVTLHDICQVLQCETPAKKNKYFFAGPALDGTHCALEKECRGGECEPVLEPSYNFKYCERDQWSEWKKDSCNSSCLEKSKGVIIKRRSCMHRRHRTASCKGPYYAVDLCDDSHLCTNNRRTIESFTTTKCTEFSSTMKYGKIHSFELEKEAGGQSNHDVDEPWIACTIFCQRRIEISFFDYLPVMEMLDIGLNPYFPDGTWCHKENDQDYYCRQHYCLPENHSVEE